MFRKPNPRRLAALLLLPFLNPSAKASPIGIGDPSFEEKSLAAEQWTNNLGPAWLETGGPDNGDGFVERINGFSADGLNHLGMQLGHDVWQDLGATFQPNTRYTLTVAVGHRAGFTNADNQSRFHLADNAGTIHASGVQNSSSIPVGTFMDATPLVFETSSSPFSIGKPIRILLRAQGGGRSHFDNIRLTSDTLIPPGGAELSDLASFSVTSTTAALSVNVADPGNDDPAITFYWGPTDGGINPAAWAFSETLPGTHNSTASLPVTGLLPNGTYRFTARAQNSAGSSWAVPSGTFETLPNPAAITTLAAGSITPFSGLLRAEVTDTGGSPPAITIHYGPTDGGTDPDAWQGSFPAGTGEGIHTAPLGGLSPSTTVFFRAFAENAGGATWAATSQSFTTQTVSLASVATLSPLGVTGASATLRAEVTDTGNDPPQVTIFLGTTDGGTNPASWTTSFNLGSQSAAFGAFASGLTPHTTYYHRARATNHAGTSWSPSVETFTTTALLPSSVVINEFHYKPADESTLGEFIELHNPGDSPADISGWRFTTAITYTFPSGTIIAPGGHLVVAQDPAVILAQYGITALGPYSGALSSKGERINLRDAADNLIDRVEYGVGFPWPAAPDGGGPSAERIHPSLDGNLAGSWRASGAPPDDDPPGPILSLQENGWRFFRGTAEASSPIQAWRDSNFDDSTWETGQTPLGYGIAGLNTTISGMRNSYSTIYMRKEFTVPAGSVPKALKVRLHLDDGCVIWLNGTEVHRHLAPPGDLAHNTLSSDFVSSPQWYEFDIPNADEILFGGTNNIAVHLLNSSLGSSDLVFDIELADADASTSTRPTPGLRNSVFAAPALIPPHIDQVAHSPQSPQSGQPVTITARITDPDGVASAALSYQLVNPGSYIRLTDPAYATTWTTVPMTTNGTGAWSVTLPGNLQTHRRLVRYRISFEDAPGNGQTVPYPDDESPNFAYFVSDGIPAWQGAFRPGQTPLETFPGETLTSVPVYTLIANDTDVINSQYNSSFNKVRMTGTFVHDDTVHDHIEFRNRGEGSIYQAGKNKWRFYFNRSSRFQAADADGAPYQETWKQFSGNPGSAAWAPLHRGAAGIDEMVPFRAYQLAGVPSPHTHHYHFRVIRGASESPAPGTTHNNSIGNADGQYLGDFWGVYLAIEPIRGNFLSERNLPDGNIYKIENNNGDKKEQAPGQPVDSSDWIAFRNTHVNTTPGEAWWRANLDLDAYYAFHTISRLTGNVDLRPGANHYYYRRSTDNRWVPIPWDLDMMFIAKHHWGEVQGVPDVIDAHRAILNQPQIALEFRNRAREILDLLASDSTPTGGQMGQLIAEISGRIHSPDATNSLAWAEAHMWNLHPRTNGTDGNASGQGNHRGNFFRSPFNDSRTGGNWTRWLRNPSFVGTGTPDDTFAYFLNYATNTWPGGTWTFNNGDQRGYGYQAVLAETADNAIPNKPTLTYTGSPGHPADLLAVTASAFSDPQGPGTFAAREWRLAEVGAPGLYEIDALWKTTSTSGDTTIHLPSGLIRPGHTYRARVRQQDNTGRWSHWSDPVHFTATPASAALVHYWNFNTTSALLTATQSAGGAALAVTGTHESGTGQDFAAANARFGDSAGAHLRVNNPLTPGTRLDIAIPTTGFSDVVANYETRRSGQGAGTQHVSYTLNGSAYFDLTTIPVTETPAIAELDFRSIPGASDNPNFAIRITFTQGAGGNVGNNRFDNLTVKGLPLVGAPRLIPVTNAPWNYPENWRHLTVPDAQGASAILGPPATANRNVALTAPVTVGDLTIETGGATFRNRLSGSGITFDGGASPALLRVSGTGTGFAELEISGGTNLATDLRLDVSNIEGDPLHGALRLREAWTGTGGLVKQGPGTASLTGGQKTFTGPVLIERGVLQFTESATPATTSGVTVLPGGQLRLTSDSTGGEERVYSFGGLLTLSGSGRGPEIPTGEQYGVLGALRHDPQSGGTNVARVTNPVHFPAAADVHVDGPGNTLILGNTLTGTGNLTKSGGGRLVLTGNSPAYSGTFAINNGPVTLNGQAPSMPVVISAGQTLTGSGSVAALSGSGTVAAGNAVLTATSSAAAHLSAILQNPGSSGNGMLRLTGPAPVTSPPQTLDLFLNRQTRNPGDRFHGGLFADALTSAIDLGGSTVRILVPDPAGPISHGGQTYRESAPADSLTWSVVAHSRDFGSGPVSGAIVEILVGGEPGLFGQWRNLHFPDPADLANPLVSGPLANPSGDGVSNLIRYAHGVGPLDPVLHLLPQIESDGGGHVFRFRHDSAKTDLAWRVRATNTLDTWPHLLLDTTADPVPPPVDGWVEIPLPASLTGDPAPDPRIFSRLEVERSGP